ELRRWSGEVLDGRDQADRPLLEQVTEGNAARAPLVRRLQDQVQVVLDQAPVGRLPLASVSAEQARLLRVGKSRITGHLGSILLFLRLPGPVRRSVGHG